MNYNIACCSIKWCKNENKRYIIIFNHMQRFYYLICQSTWCQNASKLIYQKGEISFLWDTKNVVYCKFDFHAWRWTGRWQKSNGLENRLTPGMVFPKHPVFHFAPMFHFAPTYYMCISSFVERLYTWSVRSLCRVGLSSHFSNVSVWYSCMGYHTKVHGVNVDKVVFLILYLECYPTYKTSNGSWRQGIKGEMTRTGYVALVWNIIYRIMTIIVIIIIIIIIIIMITIMIIIMIIIIIIIIIKRWWW